MGVFWRQKYLTCFCKQNKNQTKANKLNEMKSIITLLIITIFQLLVLMPAHAQHSTQVFDLDYGNNNLGAKQIITESAQLQQAASCHYLNATFAPFCSQFVNWPVKYDNLGQVLVDAGAKLTSDLITPAHPSELCVERVRVLTCGAVFAKCETDHKTGELILHPPCGSDCALVAETCNSTSSSYAPMCQQEPPKPQPSQPPQPPQPSCNRLFYVGLSPIILAVLVGVVVLLSIASLIAVLTVLIVKMKRRDSYAQLM